MAAARELPLQLSAPAAPMPSSYDALYGLLVLLGASLVVWSVTAHSGYAVAGFLLWLLGIALLLSPRAPHPVFPGVMAAAIASNSAVEKLKQFFFNRQQPAPV